MPKEKLFGPFKRKLNISNIQLIEEFYSDYDFVEFYNKALKEDSHKDLEIFRKLLSLDDTILEIGSGSGRVFNDLCNENYDIYGIEPSKEMNKYIVREYRHKIFNIRMQDIEILRDKQLFFSKIIIPATTISLFSHNDFEYFIEKVSLMVKPNGSIIFDFINPSYLRTANGKIHMLEYRESKYYFSNYIQYPYFILNVYLQRDNLKKLSYSVKHLYSLEFLQKICSKYGYNLNIISENDIYIMVEMRKYE
ncbi:class I SAM-dependent methyltransferase [Priestia filamentosa]|uniref:class I SAM-dependent methyltransferase n=1 Tax=Priestia filamentosa TaxID=1402861 RepID=UPI0039835D5A